MTEIVTENIHLVSSPSRARRWMTNEWKIHLFNPKSQVPARRDLEDQRVDVIFCFSYFKLKSNSIYVRRLIKRWNLNTISEGCPKRDEEKKSEVVIYYSHIHTILCLLTLVILPFLRSYRRKHRSDDGGKENWESKPRGLRLTQQQHKLISMTILRSISELHRKSEDKHDAKTKKSERTACEA